MAAEKRGIYFGRMLNLLVSTFRPRTERDFPSNNPQPIEITAFLRRIYFGRACHKRPEIVRFQDVFFVFQARKFLQKCGGDYEGTTASITRLSAAPLPRLEDFAGYGPGTIFCTETSEENCPFFHLAQ